jgi:hypothetical protein
LVRLDNKIKCRGCEEELKFNIESKTSNILSHVRDTKLAKHKDRYETYLKMKGVNAASVTPKQARKRNILESIDNCIHSCIQMPFKNGFTFKHSNGNRM